MNIDPNLKVQKLREMSREKAIEAIIEGSRLDEIKLAIKAILDDDINILQADIIPPRTQLQALIPLQNGKKSIYRGVSMNGKKWQVS